MVALRVGSPVVNCIAAQNQDGVLSYREWILLGAREPVGAEARWVTPVRLVSWAGQVRRRNEWPA